MMLAVVALLIAEAPALVDPAPANPAPANPASVDPAPANPAPAKAEPSAPEASPPKPKYDGGLTKSEIQGSITPVMPLIKACYELELGKDGALAGKLMMTWVITGEGAVTDATVAQNTFLGPRAPVVGDCVKKVISRLKFPQPKGGGNVFVTYPFVFSSSVEPRTQPLPAPAPPLGCGLFAR